MNDFSLIEKIEILFNLVSTSPLFLVVSFAGIMLLIFLIVLILLNKKINKKIFIIILILISTIFLVNYGTTILKIFDAITDNIFMALYFPSLPVYVTVITFSNLMFLISIFNKNETKSKKIINTINSIILNFLLVLIIDVVAKKNINIYEEINLYTNSNLLVLLELSMGVFVSWILISLISSAHFKLKKFDKVEIYNKPEIIFDDF